MTPRHFNIGVDLGKLRDFTAISVIERYSYYSHRDPVNFCDIYQWTNIVRRTERLRIGTSYPRAVERIAALTRDSAQLGSVRLVVDATGVGEPVMDLIRQESLPCELVPIVITSGETASRARTGWHVPRQELLVNLQMIFARRELVIPSDLPLRRNLIDELSDMSRNHHDDLAFSLALAAWPLRPKPRIGEQSARLF